MISFFFLGPAAGRLLTPTTAIAHQSWIDYMHKPSPGLTGAVCRGDDGDFAVDDRDYI